MNTEYRDFSKDYEKPEAALAQFATGILHPLSPKLGTARGGRRHRESRNGEPECLCQVPAFRLWTFYHSGGKVELTRTEARSEVHTCT